MAAQLETEILTERLLLRPLEESDAPAIQRLAGDERVARFTALIPHPYPDGEAERFIASARKAEAGGTVRHFAIALREAPRALVGIVSVRDVDVGLVELGYWLGVPWWGRGLMSEAVAAAVAFAGDWRPGATLAAHTFPENAASQRVLEKAGFARRGTGVCDAPARACREVVDAPLFVLETSAA